MKCPAGVNLRDAFPLSHRAQPAALHGDFNSASCGSSTCCTYARRRARRMRKKWHFLCHSPVHRDRLVGPRRWWRLRWCGDVIARVARGGHGKKKRGGRTGAEGRSRPRTRSSIVYCDGSGGRSNPSVCSQPVGRALTGSLLAGLPPECGVKDDRSPCSLFSFPFDNPALVGTRPAFVY